MCTDFLLAALDPVTKSPTYVNGRSMEFGDDLMSRLTVRAPGTPFQSPDLGGGKGLSWVSKHGYVGLDAFALGLLTDGMNTQGLSAGALWLPGSSYPTPTNPACALAPEMFVDWALGTCATVEDVRSALAGGQAQVFESAWLAMHAPLHFPVHDAQGGSILVEFVGGEMAIYDNPVGVTTNAPPFPMHLAALGDYAGLTPQDPTPLVIGGQPFAPAGHGGGMVGLPGDATPPSRFARAALLKQYALTPKDAAEATDLAFHVLNAVDIPKGFVRSKGLRGPEYDHTQWVVVKDLTNLVLSTRFYGNMCVYSVDLKTLDFAAANGQQLAVPASPASIDLTSRFGSATGVDVTEAKAPIARRAT